MTRNMSRKREGQKGILPAKARPTAGYVLVEVLLSLTILAIAGVAIMRSFTNAIDTTQEVRDLAKVVFLTEGKLHELEMAYDLKAPESVKLGELNGRYTQPGAENFLWHAQIDKDKNNISYLISVWTTEEEDLRQSGHRRFRRSHRRDYQGFMLKTMVPAARVNESLLFGGTPGQRSQGSGSRGGNRGGGERGSSQGGRGR